MSTAGDVAFFGDVVGNFFILDSGNGKVLFKLDVKDAVGGGAITYDTGARQKVALSTEL